jgi:hypothetical protein
MVYLGRERFAQAAVVRVLVVVQDHVLVHLLEAHGYVDPPVAALLGRI